MNKIKFYKQFEYLNRFDRIKIFSDPHFGDSDCKLMDENWVSPDDQVKLINQSVGKNDCLIILGDIGDISYVHKLNGYKILIKGNHDRGNSYYKKSVIRKSINCSLCPSFNNLNSATEWGKKHISNFIRWIKAPLKEYELSLVDFAEPIYEAYINLFDEVFDGPVFLNKNICLSHEDIKLSFGVNIHGHDHKGEKIKQDENSASINVAANIKGVDYKPQDLVGLLSQVKVKDIHRVTIDNAIAEKDRKNSEKE